MAKISIQVLLDEAQVRELDRIVKAGLGRSRAACAREAVSGWIEKKGAARKRAAARKKKGDG